MNIYLNGRLVSAKEAVVSVFDHGFLYGDGIYETLRVYDGVIFKIAEHLQRFYRSASLIGLTIPFDSDHLKTAIYETLLANSLNEAYVRLTMSRGPGAIGLDPDFCPEPTTVIIAQEFKEYPASYYKKGISMIIAGTRRNIKEAINPQIKSLNFLNNVLAKIEAKKSNAHEAVMLNSTGKVAEGTISNIFFCRNGVLCTPSIACGILDGVTRGMIVELAGREGLEIKEGKFVKKDIYEADEVFITNTTMEVMPVSRVDDRIYPVGRMARLLRKLYRREIKAYVADIKSEGPSLWAE